MIEIIRDHYVDQSLMKDGGWVLDLGCVGFKNVEYFLRKGFKVIGVEAAKKSSGPQYQPGPLLSYNKNFKHLQKACVGIKKSETVTFYEYVYGGANSLVTKPEMLHQDKYDGHANNPFKEEYEVSTTTISEIMDELDIEELEYIKIDIEGAEYELLENLPNGIKQFSVEFHDFLDLGPDPDNVEAYHDNLNNNILKDYKRVIEKRGWRNNIDDCLYVRRDLL